MKEPGPKVSPHTPHSAGRSRSADGGLVTSLCVMILKLSGVSWGQGLALKEESEKKKVSFLLGFFFFSFFFSPSNCTCSYFCLPVQRPRYHFQAIKHDTSFLEACRTQHEPCISERLGLLESRRTAGELNQEEGQVQLY